MVKPFIRSCSSASALISSPSIGRVGTGRSAQEYVRYLEKSAFLSQAVWTLLPAFMGRLKHTKNAASKMTLLEKACLLAPAFISTARPQVSDWMLAARLPSKPRFGHHELAMHARCNAGEHHR